MAAGCTAPGPPACRQMRCWRCEPLPNQQRARGSNPVTRRAARVTVIICSWPRCGRRLDGLKDEPGGGLRLRHERDVRGRHLHDRRVRALGHEVLERWRDSLVLGAEQGPARQRGPVTTWPLGEGFEECCRRA